MELVAKEFSYPNTKVYYGSFPKILETSISKYKSLLSSFDYMFLLKYMQTAAVTGESYAVIYNENINIPVICELSNCNGDLGMLVSLDLPWEVQRNIANALQPYTNDMGIEIYSSSDTCVLDTSVLQGDTVGEKFKNFVKKYVHKNVNPHIYGAKRSYYTYEYSVFDNSLDFQEDLCTNYSKYISRFKNLDINNVYYSDIISSGARIHKVTLNFNPGMCCIYAIELENSLFCDPYIDGDISKEVKQKISPYSLAHIYLVELALKLNKRYVDFSIMYDYKRFLGLPCMKSFSVRAKDKSMNMMDVFTQAIDNAHKDNKKVMLTYTSIDGISIPLEDNMKASNDYIHISMPCYNTPLIKHDITDNAFFFSLPNVVTAVKDNLNIDNGDFFFDPLYDLYKEHNKYGYINQPMQYSSHALDLEKDRSIGKKYISKIGLNAGKYIHITNEKDFDYDYVKEMLGQTIVVKFNKYSFIGKFNVDYVKSNLSNWLKTDSVILEEDLGNCESEIAYTFALNNDYVLPLMTLWESNRLFNDNSGGKTGSTATFHKVGITDDFGKLVYNKLCSLYSEMVQDYPKVNLFGWMDVSFMKTSKGYIFTEFMTRFGCSNTLVIMRHMKTPFSTLWNALKNKEQNFELEFHAKYSAGVDILGVTLNNDSAGAETALSNITDEYNRLKTLRLKRRYFDIMHPSLYYYDNKVYSRGDMWYGTCTGLGDTPAEAIGNAYSMACQVNLPNCTYKHDAFSELCFNL